MARPLHPKQRRFLTFVLIASTMLSTLIPYPAPLLYALEADSQEETAIEQQEEVGVEVEEEETSQTDQFIDEEATYEETPEVEVIEEEVTPEETPVVEEQKSEAQNEAPANVTESQMIGSKQVFVNIQTGVEYAYSVNSGVKIKFTSLPEGNNSFSIQEIIVNISEDFVTAYEFLTPMADGTFTYEMTLPNTVGAEAQVKYSEDRTNFVDAGNEVVNGTEVSLNADHFTVFVVISNPTPPPANTQEGYVDNEEGGNFATTGTWTVSGAACIAAADPYNANAVYAQGGGAVETATWSFDVPLTGTYRVYASAVENQNRPTNAPFTVNHALGASAVTMDQDNGSATCSWSGFELLGTFDFNASTTYSVVLSSAGIGTEFVSADAIRLELVEDEAVVTSVTSTATGTYTQGQTITLDVTFSENVTVTGIPRIQLETGATDQYATYTSGSGTSTLTFSYTVVADDSNADLDYISTSIDLNGGTIVESSTNNANLTLPVVGTFAAAHAIVVDALAPAVPTLVSPADGTYSTTAALTSIDWSDSTDISNPVVYYYQSATTNTVGAENALTAPIYTSGALATSDIATAGTPEGVYYYQFRACDNAANCSDWSGPFVVTVDNTFPVITINNDVEAGPVMSDTVNVTVTDTNADTTTYEYGFSADAVCDGSDTYGNAFITATDFTFNTEANNGQYLCIVASDLAGNTSYALSANDFNIDATAPVVSAITITSAANNPAPWVRGQGFTLTANVSDLNGIDGTTCQYSLDNGTTWSPALPTANLISGPRCRFTGVTAAPDNSTVNILIRVNDTVGNTGVSPVETRTVDLNAPVTTITAVNPTYTVGAINYTSGSPDVTATILDSVSDITTCDGRYRINGSGAAGWSAWMPGVWNALADECTVSFSGLTDATAYDFQVRGEDSTNHTGNSAVLLNRIVDASAPVVDAGTDKTVNATFVQDAVVDSSIAGTATFAWTNETPGVGSITFGSPSAEDTTMTPDADGVYTVRLTVTDNVGNVSSDEMTLVWDTTAPQLQSLTSTTADGTYGPGSVINLVATYDENLAAGSTITVTLDNGVQVTLSNIAGMTLTGTYTVGATGSGEDTTDLTVSTINSHYVEDALGNNDNDTTLPATNIADGSDIVIDVTAPAVPTLLTPADGTITDNVTFDHTWSTEVGAVSYTFEECAVDPGDAGAACSSVNGTTTQAGTTLNIAAGEPNQVYWWRVLATDSVGNVSAYSESFQLSIDGTDPSITLDAYTPDPSNDNTPTYTGNTVDNVDATYESGIDSVEYMVVDNGTATTVINWTAVGATDGDYDSANENYTFTTSALADGNYTVSVRAYDNAGNVSTIATDTLTIDTTAPVLQSFTSTNADGVYGPGSVINLVATYNENLEPGSTITVTLDNGVQVTLNTIVGMTLTGTYTVGATGSGEDTLALDVATIDSQSVTDAANNTNSSTTMPGVDIDTASTIEIDVTAPAVPTPLTPADGAIIDNVAFSQTWTSSVGAVSYYYESCHVDPGDANGACSNIRFTSNYAGTTKNVGAGQPNGQLWWRVRATDSVGNTSVFSPSFELSIDGTNPSVTLNAYTPDPTNNAAQTFTGNAVDNVSATYESGIDYVEYMVVDNGTATTVVNWTTATPTDGTFDSVNENYEFTLGLTDGNYTVTVRSVDEAGNTSIVATDTFTVDLTPPVGTVTVGTAVIFDGDLIQEVTVTYNEDMDQTVDPTITFGTTTGTWSVSTAGSWTNSTTYTISYVITDADEETAGVTASSSGAQDIAGNVEDPSTDDTFDVDTLNPTGAWVAPLNGDFVSGNSVTLDVTANDVMSGISDVVFEYSPTTAGTWTSIATISTSPYTTTWDTTGLTDGDYDLRATLTDGAGNVTELIIMVTVDNSPAIITGEYGNTLNYNGTLLIDVDAEDVTANVASINYEIIDGTNTTVLSGGVTNSYTPGTITCSNGSLNSDFGLGNCVSASENVDITSLTTANYDVRVCATDTQGNSGTGDDSSLPTGDNVPTEGYCYRYTVFIDNTLPTANDLDDQTFSEGDAIPSIQITGNDNYSLVNLCYVVTHTPSGSNPNTFDPVGMYIGCEGVTGGPVTTFNWDLQTILNNATGLTDFDTSEIHEGVYTISYVVIDESFNVSDSDLLTAGTQPYTVNYTVSNVAPQITFGSDQTIDEGQDATFTASFTDPSTVDNGDGLFDDADWTVSIDFGEGAGYQTLGTMSTPGDIVAALGAITNTYENADNSPFTVTLQVCEAPVADAGIESENECSTATVTVTVNNIVPDITLTPSTTNIDELADVTFTTSVTSGNSPFTYTWSDDCSALTGDNGSLTGLTNGTYTCTVMVTDVDGDTDTDSVVVTVNNVVPVVDLTPDSTSMDELADVNFLATVTGAGNNTPVSYSWTGACAAFGNSATGSLTGLTNGTYTCDVTVTDVDGDTATDSTTITVDNIVPTVILTPSVVGPVDELATISYTTAVSGLGNNGPVTYNWSDDCAAFSGDNGTLVDLLQGIYTCTVSVTDADGDTSQDSTVVIVVQNVAPVLSAIGVNPQPATEGSSVTFVQTFTDLSTDGLWTVTVNYGDGNTTTYTVDSVGSVTIPAHTYAANGSYTMTVTIEDKDGGIDTETTTVVVNTVGLSVILFGNAPSSNSGGVVSVAANTNFTISSSVLAANPGNAPYDFVFSGTCSGTANNTGSVFTSNVMNLAAGSYVCLVQVTDADGDRANASVLINVAGGVVAGLATTTTESTEEEPEVLGLSAQTCEEQEDVSGFVYIDANNNDSRDSDEKGAEGARLEIFVFDNEGDEVKLETVVTNENGEWETELCPGEYNLRLLQSSLADNLRIQGDDVIVFDVAEGSDTFGVAFTLEEVVEEAEESEDDSSFPYWIIPLLLLAILLISGGVYGATRRRD